MMIMSLDLSSLSFCGGRRGKGGEGLIITGVIMWDEREKRQKIVEEGKET